MRMTAVRFAAFLIGSLVAGCVYASHHASPARGDVTIDRPSVYPSARATSGDLDGDAADVTVHVPMAALHMTARRYRTTASPSAVETFYRKSLAALGPVMIAHDGPHTRIQGFVWRRGPHDVTVAAGKTFVAIAPRATGTEFAIVTIQPQTP